MRAQQRQVSFGLGVFAVALVLGGCGSKGNNDDSVTVQGDVPIAFVKRPINPNDREVAGNPTDSVIDRKGSDLYVKSKSSPSSAECNITTSYTHGQGDVSDPEVSFDGNRILFAMRGEHDETWDIWEADVTVFVRGGNCGGVTLRRLINDNGKSHGDPNVTWGDDVDPAYLPDGRIVFSSNRQEKTYRTLGRKYLDEYERENSIVLHTMKIDGDPVANAATIQQISFNMSHDRNPTALDDGTIMFSRWDHVGGRNQFTIFKINADGTGLFVLFGAHSGVNSYLHPRMMPDGRIMSDGMPLQRTNEGGALLIIDSKDFAENGQGAPGVSGDAQMQPSSKPVDPGMRSSPNGRFTTPYPLADGTNRALVTFTPGGRTENVMERDLLTGKMVPTTREKTPAYGVYMMDLRTGALRAVAIPRVNAKGDPVEMIVDPVPLVPRSSSGGGAGGIIPIQTTSGDDDMTTRGVGRLSVKSIYDTDSENRMNNAVLNAWERQGRGTNSDSILIPTVSANSLECNAVDPRPRSNCDTRHDLADLMTLKDPAKTPADNRPGRFVRISRAVPTVSGITREVIGETEFEMQQILGYVPVEPDGSFSVEVPADTPLALAVTDAYGRAFQTHTSWLNVRPGESVTCKGCHSPRRSSPNALNQKGSTLAKSIAGNNPNSALQDNIGTPITGGSGSGLDGQTMAETRLGLDRTGYQSIRSFNLEYQDIWTSGVDSLGNVLPKANPISIRYDGSTFKGQTKPGIPAAEQPTTVAIDGPTRQPAIVINYVDNVQPIWQRNCVGCHTGTAQPPDLSGSASGSGRVASYDALLIGKPKIKPDGTPVLKVEDDELVVDRETAFVDEAFHGLGRGTILIQKIFPQGLKNPADFAADPHATYLNPSEKRVIAEWIDIGAQYYNDPCLTRNAGGGCATFRGVSGLDEGVFTSTIQPLLLTQCAGCHVATGRTPNDPPFQAKRLVLTGSPGDFNVTVNMVNNVCNSAASDLLRFPTSDSVAPNPVHPSLAATPPGFTVGSADYNTIKAWIDAARSANGCP